MGSVTTTNTPGTGKISTRPVLIPADVPALGAIGRAAFGYSSRLLFPNPKPNDTSTEQDEVRWRGGRLVARIKSGNVAFVAVTTEPSPENGQDQEVIVGVAQWKVPAKNEAKWKELVVGGLHGDFSDYGAEGNTEWDEAGKFPSSMDTKKFDELMGIIAREERRILDEQGLGEGDVWYLQTLAAHPDYKRRGIGTTLLQWGIDQAKADKANLFLTATGEGKYLYERQGFVQLSEFDVCGYPHFAMMWFYRPEGDSELAN
ncbi:hypothetical protein V8F33_004964 [Rhypophila sp. PSN 637]